MLFSDSKMEVLSPLSKLTASKYTQVVSVPDTVVGITKTYTVKQPPTKAPTPECSNFTFNIQPSIAAELLVRKCELLVEFQVSR